MSVINMSKSNKINMSKDDGTPIKKIFIGANWDANRYSGEAEIDFDLSGLTSNSDRRVTYPVDVVNFNTYGDGRDYPWIEYSGDNRTGDDSTGVMFNGKHYDEAFIVHTEQFPENRTDFTICLTIHRAVQRLQTFGMVQNATLDIFDYDNPSGTSWTYDLSEDPNFENLNAVEIGRLYKHNGGFKFQAIGSGYVGGMTELFKNFGLEIDEGRD